PIYHSDPQGRNYSLRINVYEIHCPVQTLCKREYPWMMNRALWRVYDPYDIRLSAHWFASEKGRELHKQLSRPDRKDALWELCCAERAVLASSESDGGRRAIASRTMKQ
ncbi:hypothetical protein Bpfe_029592, partial [Biomphalaria pfeifferi]